MKDNMAMSELTKEQRLQLQSELAPLSIPEKIDKAHNLLSQMEALKAQILSEGDKGICKHKDTLWPAIFEVDEKLHYTILSMVKIVGFEDAWLKLAEEKYKGITERYHEVYYFMGDLLYSQKHSLL